MASEQSKYFTEYAKTHYDKINLTLPKGTAKIIKHCAVDKGVSVSQLVIQALEKVYDLDLSKKDN